MEPAPSIPKRDMCGRDVNLHKRRETKRLAQVRHRRLKQAAELRMANPEATNGNKEQESR
jgi:hypothetical protein